MSDGTPSNDEMRGAVRDTYAEVALAGSGCCGTPLNTVPSETLGYSADQLAAIPADSDLGLGCGNPTALAGLRPGDTVIDLGAGGGLDCFLAAREVGPTGRVIGVDMTPEMIAKARANAAKGGCANVEFRLGEIEHLPLADGVADVIISNCVINLSPDKRQVLAEAFRVLKPGGRLHVSDVVETEPLPAHFRDDARLTCGCMGNAASTDALFDWLREAGFTDISIAISEASRGFIAEWAPGTGIEAFVASAAITASKPG